MKHYFILILLLISLTNCKKKTICNDEKNPNCSNYDPCIGKSSVFTNFKVIPGTNGFQYPAWCQPESCDTLTYSSVRFAVPEGNTDNTKYKWQIGSDTFIRTAKKFELSFFDYLEMGNWEKSIPVTLTIRRPLDNCLKKPSDTLVVVTRNIFFTKKRLMSIFDKNTPIFFKGYFTNEPTKEVVLKFFILDTFRGRIGELGQGLGLITGYPFTDTLLNTVGSCGKSEFCDSYKHTILKFPWLDCSFQKLTGYLYQLEYTYYDDKRIRIFRDCHFPTGFKQYEFIGTKQ